MLNFEVVRQKDSETKQENLVIHAYYNNEDYELDSINVLKDYLSRLHMLRHTFASLMKNELPLEIVSEILGHKDISTTIRFYASQTTEDYRRTSIGVESMMKKITTGRIK